MPTQVKKKAPGVPDEGTYITDVDRTNLYRIESIHRKEGVVIEDCRSGNLFMLTIREYQRTQFKELG